MICPYCDDEVDESEYEEFIYFGRPAFFFLTGRHAPGECKLSERFLKEVREHLEKFGVMGESGLIHSS